MSHLLTLAQTAQAAPPPALTSTPTDAMWNLITLVLLFAGMYFLLIAPQRQKEKAQQKLLSELKKGDEVLTIGGIIGTIEKLSDERATLRTGGNVVIEFQRSAIQGKITPEMKEEKK